MHYENKPLDEKRFFNAGSFRGSELKYFVILQMYQQAQSDAKQSDANKIHNLI